MPRDSAVAMNMISQRKSDAHAPLAADLLLMFGATGDLAKRMLLPSLFALHVDALLPESLEILCTGRSELDDDSYRRMIADTLEKSATGERGPRNAIDQFLQRVRYLPLDVSDARAFAKLSEVAGDAHARRPAIFLSTAPSLFEPTIAGLQQAGFASAQARIGLEKPLGKDYTSSCAINDAVRAAFPEASTYRIDHYLGKETVQNLLVLRFGNSLFEPLWNAAHIDHVQITVSETVGLEDRAGFYDDAGALRDMVQNHMLQLLALVAMEAPAEYDPASVRDEKVKVLRSLRPIEGATINGHVVLGQYGAGAVGGQPVPGYADELGRASATETFVALKAHVDNWRWKGVPFYLRTGKRLPTRYSEIVIQLKGVPHSIFGGTRSPLQANTLVIRLQPEEYVRLYVMAKEPGLDRGGIRLQEVPLDFSLSSTFEGRRRIAYERLLLDLIEGDPTLFVRRDEVEAQWQWVDGIRAACGAVGVQPRRYTAGTWGPAASIALTERDGVSWHE
jgi:glucose-6-phosphate 1-dehydrogenase